MFIKTSLSQPYATASNYLRAYALAVLLFDHRRKMFRIFRCDILRRFL